MPCTAAHKKLPVQWWRRLSVCALVKRHLQGIATGGRAPMTAVAEAPTTAGGGKAKGGKGDDLQSNRKRKALLFFQKQGRGGGKRKGASFRGGGRLRD